MKIKFLLLGTSLSFIPTLTFAQCVATQDCATLGYTETSCNGGKGVKCPFGNKWACIGITAEQCTELGFTYTCTGTGEKGVGNACNGKYQGCSCSSPYTWSGSACTCPSNYTYTCSAPATPAVQALLATANTPPAPAPSDMNGKMEAARNKFSTAPKVSCITAMARWLASALQV